MDAAVELKNVSFEKDGYKILKNVSASFPRGKSTVIMGLSGSGKSTLLKAAAGILFPDAGTVSLFGKDFFKASDSDVFRLRGRMGFVFQDAALWSNLSTYQNLSLPLQFHRRFQEKRETEDRINALIQEFEFRDNLQLRPASLSAGERKIISFIRALVLDPEILFLDEPTSFVDNASSDKMLGILKRLKQAGKTLVTATHTPTLAAQLADRLLVLGDGEILEQGDVQDVAKSTNPAVKQILSDVLLQTAVYDSDILDLLGGES